MPPLMDLRGPEGVPEVYSTPGRRDAVGSGLPPEARADFGEGGLELRSVRLSRAAQTGGNTYMGNMFRVALLGAAELNPCPITFPFKAPLGKSSTPVIPQVRVLLPALSST